MKRRPPAPEGRRQLAPATRAWGCVHTGRWRPRLDRLPASSEANS